MLEMYQQGSVESPTLWMKLAKHIVWNVEEKVEKHRRCRTFGSEGQELSDLQHCYGLTFLLDYERK